MFVCWGGFVAFCATRYSPFLEYSIWCTKTSFIQDCHHRHDERSTGAKKKLVSEAARLGFHNTTTTLPPNIFQENTKPHHQNSSAIPITKSYSCAKNYSSLHCTSKPLQYLSATKCPICCLIPCENQERQARNQEDARGGERRGESRQGKGRMWDARNW